ncbi:hypothetical protein QBC46DRAFT_391804 [Diplogelasinospora grovesii]|uniref:Protein kinase domain-containing protein n=1 Tax=Diplogelasinospora grovesii TaxID=303347 RepID=A0AAN6S284_9PEZI|nr:hypothetical protein QBC46DRAFT_391804 [Diplogelasinospora grovesii]
MSSSEYEGPSWGIQEIYLTCESHLIIAISYGAARIEVQLHQTRSGRAAEDKLIKEYKAACDAEDEDKEMAVAERVADQIMETGKPVFDKLAPVQSAEEDFHSLIFPEKFAFSLSTVKGRWQITKLEEEPHTNVPGRREPMRTVLEDDTAMDEPDDGFSDEDMDTDQDDLADDEIFLVTTTADLDLPRYSTKDIKLIERLDGFGIVARVVVDGQERCVKVLDRDTRRAVQREFDCLKKIAASPYAATMRTPKLLGIVVVPDDGRAIGIVEEYISHPEVYEMSNLGRIGKVTKVDKKRRAKWASQIQETVARLHEIGVVWGDAKPSNVLIESGTDDVRVIDFGGGFTTPWVNDKLAETVQGDDEAVRKIAKYLKV